MMVFENQVSAFSTAANIDTAWLIECINNAPANDEQKPIVLSQIKLMYVDRCIILNQSLDDFRSALTKVIEIANKYKLLFETRGQPDTFPWYNMILNKSDDQILLYKEIIHTMKPSMKHHGINALNSLLVKYSDSNSLLQVDVDDE
jgi:sRNA-binding regulator protein Hfq